MNFVQTVYYVALLESEQVTQLVAGPFVLDTAAWNVAADLSTERALLDQQRYAVFAQSVTLAEVV